MRKLILLALPLATFMLLAGCDQYEANRGYGTSTSTTASTATTVQSAPAQQSQPTTAYQPTTSYQPSRNSTTQPLPQGWGYVHEQDLTGGRLPPAASAPTYTTSAPVVAAGGS